MQELVAAVWADRREQAPHHIGDLAGYTLRTVRGKENQAGEFEPVGTHPDHRGRGLGAATCAFALRRLQEQGGRTARALHESLGFHLHSHQVEWRRSR
jgi:GNAT superfamily N-acetyltransferase